MIFFEFGPVVEEEMPFKGISYLELWQPFCSAESNYLCGFVRGYPEEQFCEIILNLGQWFRRGCQLKDFLSGALAALVFSGANIYATLKEGIIGNIHVKLYEIWTRCRLKKKFLHGRRTNDGRRLITIPHLEPSAQVS